MKHVYTRHLRGAYSVIRSIERSEAIWSTIIFLALGFCVGALFAIGN